MKDPLKVGIDPFPGRGLSVLHRDAMPSRSPEMRTFYDKLTYDRDRRAFVGRIWDGTWGPGNNFDFKQFTLDEVLAACVDEPARALARKMASE